MFDQLVNLLAQLEGDTSAVAEKAVEAGNEAAQKGPGLWQFLIPMMLVMLVFMLFSRPKKSDQKSRERLKDLKKNDQVITAGGIIGTVVTAGKESEHITLRIDDTTNARMQIMKSSIIKVLSDEKADAKK